MTASSIRNSLLALASVAVLALLWKLAALAVGSEIILPSPEAVVRDLAGIMLSSGFWAAVGATLIRGLASFFISCLLGLAAGLLTGFSSTAYWLAQPLLTALRSTPVMSVILLALIWFRADLVPVFVGFLMAFPIVCGNVSTGIRNVDRQLLEMARIYRVPARRILFEVQLPSMAPFLIAGLSTAMGITWRVIVAAEVLSQPGAGLGTQMQLARDYLDTTRLFALTVVILAIGFLFESLLRVAENRLQDWR
jgi:NitT/TauT family transport system permease protein